MGELLEELNHYFGGDAKFEVKKGKLEITVGLKTLVISIPEVTGAHSTPLWKQS